VASLPRTWRKRLTHQEGSVPGVKSPRERWQIGYGRSLRQQERPPNPRVLLHQRGLTVTYVRLSEAPLRNVGTAPTLPHHHPVAADLASGERVAQGRGSVVVAGVTSGHRDGSAVTGRREPGQPPLEWSKG